MIAEKVDIVVVKGRVSVIIGDPEDDRPPIELAHVMPPEPRVGTLDFWRWGALRFPRHRRRLRGAKQPA